MNDNVQRTDAKRDYSDFTHAAAWSRRRSPLNDPAWRLVLTAAGLGCVGAIVAQVWSGGGAAATLLATLLLAAGWVQSVRFLLLDSALRRVWMVWLGLGGVALLVAGSHPLGRYLAIGMAIVFLVLRRYLPYRHLTSGRRARAFGLGLLTLILLIAMPKGPGYDETVYPVGLAWNVGNFARVASILFWIFSLWNLVIHMRLHFMRLRPKLATSAALLGLVPLALVVLLGALILYGALGGSRATRARDMMNAWAAMADRGVDLTGDPFTPGFVWSEGAGRIASGAGAEPTVTIAAPDWASRLAAELRAARAGQPLPAKAVAESEAEAEREAEREAKPEAKPEAAPGADDDADEDRELNFTFGGQEDEEPTRWLPADTTAYFRIDEETWLLRVTGLGEERIGLSGWLVDQSALDRLAAVVKADVSLGIGDDDTDGDFIALTGPVASGVESGSDSAIANPQQAERWYDRLYFGGALLGVLRTDGTTGFVTDERVLVLKVGLSGLQEEFFGGEQNFNIAWLAVVALVASLFLIIELFAMFFGFRIAGGITSAVGTLHRGTERLAAGDLTTRIDVPNEDEFGDLADSFNAMTVAVAKGREDAVARERLIRELETARQIQQRLLPDENPHLAGFQITGASVPSRQVGGDYFDFLAQGDGRMGIAIGDVSGKGMPAALLMANLQASLQGQVIHPSSVAEVVARVNDLLARSTDPHMFATFFYGVLDPHQGSFTATNAGHNPPILRRADGRVELLEAGGLVLGMLPDQQYRQETVALEPGDVLVLYTDGITEATAADSTPGLGAGSDTGTDARAALDSAIDEDEDEEDIGEMFSEEALQAVIDRSAHLSAAGIKEAILDAVIGFTSGAPQSDDITLVVIKRDVNAKE